MAGFTKNSAAACNPTEDAGHTRKLHCVSLFDAIQTFFMRVLIAFNEPVLPATHPEIDAEREILDVVASISARIDQPGLDVDQFGVGRDLTVFSDVLQDLQPDVVLNLFEGFGDAS